MSNSTPRSTTDTRSRNAIALINEAVENQDPARRAGFLADAQRQIAYALSSALDECEQQGVTWAAVGDAVGLGRETVWRQHKSGGPIVVIKSTHNASQGEEMLDTVYAFETESNQWYGAVNALAPGQYSTGTMPFNPNPITGHHRFGGQMLRVRIGQQPAAGVSAYAAMVHLPDGSPRRIRVTDRVMDLLLNDGETPMRQQMGPVYHAVIAAPDADAILRQAVTDASNTMNPLRFTAEQFVDAVHTVLETAETHPTNDDRATAALNRLADAYTAYQAWLHAEK